ncbi:serine hydrolase [Streptomyces poriticola]|uniref:serine hydrolase n=1 Tax=Streptomyces poriticola TaxID=3120506 RepID=UPI002FCDE26E
MPDKQPDRTQPTQHQRKRTLRVCAATAVAASLAACSATGAAHQTSAPTERTSAPAPGQAAPRENPGAALARALRPVLPGGDTRLAVAVLGLDGADQEIAAFGHGTTFDSASIIKVNILAALLLMAQDQNRGLTAAEHDMAEAMIRTSDNDAANVLWRAIGRAEGLDAANARLGLAATHGGPGVRWGLTRTTAADQVRLLRAVFAPEPAASARPPEGLDRASRAYIRRLMGSVTPDQDWGVSAAGTPKSRYALKNGWLQRDTTGLWIINSIGHITVHGRRYLISVLSSGNTTMSHGISLVEQAARAAIDAVGTDTRARPT